MTITNEIVLDGTPLAAVGVWYTPFGLADSSFVEDAKVRYTDDGGEVKFIIRGEDYIFKVEADEAREAYVSLNAGYSPGSILNEVKVLAAEYRSRPRPVLQKSVTITGDEATINFVVAHAEALGLLVY
jgi:hypothetical protein